MAYSERFKAEAARLGLTPYGLRVQRGQERGLSPAQAAGKPAKGQPSITELVKRGELARPRTGKLAQPKPYVPKGGGRRPRRTTQTAAGTVTRTTSNRAALGALRAAAAAGHKVTVQATVDAERGVRTLSSDTGRAEGGAGPLIDSKPIGPMVIIDWRPGVGPNIALPAAEVLRRFRNRDDRSMDFDEWFVAEFYEEDYF